MVCYVRECIKLAHDLGAPICKIFAAWRGITIHDGIATYDLTYGHDQFRFWKGDRWGFVVDGIRELSKMAEDFGVVLALQNHGPDVITTYQEVLRMIEEVGSPAFKGCMDINIEPDRLLINIINGKYSPKVKFSKQELEVAQQTLEFLQS